MESLAGFHIYNIIQINIIHYDHTEWCFKVKNIVRYSSVTLIISIRYCFSSLLCNNCAIVKIGAFLNLSYLCLSYEWIQSIDFLCSGFTHGCGNSLLWGIFGSAKLASCIAKGSYLDTYLVMDYELEVLFTMIIILWCSSKNIRQEGRKLP